MPSLDDLFTQLETLVEQERVAVRHLDGRTVEQCIQHKQSLLGQLQSMSFVGQHHIVPRTQTLLRALQHNAVLLAHARDYLRDATSTMPGNADRTATLLSRRG